MLPTAEGGRKMKRLALVLLGCWFAFAGVVSAQPANVIIVAGLAVGDVRLGMTQPMVLNRLGQPDETKDDSSIDGETDIFWMYRHDENRILVVSWTARDRVAGGVDFLYVDSPKYVTSRGIQIGRSGFASVLERYGVPDRVGPLRNGVGFTYDSLGIRLRISAETGLVTAIIVVPRKVP